MGEWSLKGWLADIQEIITIVIIIVIIVTNASIAIGHVHKRIDLNLAGIYVL